MKEIKKINSIEELKNPEMKSYDYAEGMINDMPEITKGTEKQIKFAKDLRKDFLSQLVNRDNKASIRWAFLHADEEKNYRRIAEDAMNRIMLRKMATNDAKEIINVFCDNNAKIKQDSRIIDFIKILKGKKNF